MTMSQYATFVIVSKGAKGTVKANNDGEQKMKNKVIAIFALMLFSGLAVAHSGGTDRYGCHKNHKTGVYHCH